MILIRFVMCRPPLLRISDQLIAEGYKLVLSVMKGTLRDSMPACLMPGMSGKRDHGAQSQTRPGL